MTNGKVNLSFVWDVEGQSRLDAMIERIYGKEMPRATAMRLIIDNWVDSNEEKQIQMPLGEKK